jgi:two-component system sensor histidine kinase BaeS
MAAILALVAGTLVLAAVGTLLLVRRASSNTAEQQLYTEARALAVSHPDVFLQDITAVTYVGRYDALTIVGLDASRRFTANLPASLDGLALDPRAIARGRSVAGTHGDLVYVLIPLQLTVAQDVALKTPVPTGDTAVLVATRTSKPPVAGVGYFVLLGLVCLAVAAAVAYWLALRFSRPLVTAADATVRIAGGDLDSPIPVGRHDVPELASLAAAINTMSERLQRARDQQRLFLQSVSHELRTPLTSIRGYAEAVADGTTDDVAGAVDVIGSEAERLDRLVQDLIDLSRLEAERFRLDRAPVDMTEVVTRGVARARPECAGRGVAIDFDVNSDGPLWVNGDVDRLAQVLSNLIGNAARFAASRISVGLGSCGGSVELSVDDDGPGIAPDDLARVFEPHFSSDRTGGSRRGTGLGLAIVSELAAAMGGGVRATSPVTPNGGTRMVVWLPQMTSGSNGQ